MEQQPSQANVEFWFRQLYELWGRLMGLDPSSLAAYLSGLWNWIIAIGYAVSVFALFVLVYVMVRLFELRRREHDELTTLISTGEKAANTRWAHIEELLKSGTPSDRRQAIIEADIMLDDTLTKAGYQGDTVGDKLKAIHPSNLSTLQNAWEAHKVRNQIAHDGSAFDLSQRSPSARLRATSQSSENSRPFRRRPKNADLLCCGSL